MLDHDRSLFGFVVKCLVRWYVQLSNGFRAPFLFGPCTTAALSSFTLSRALLLLHLVLPPHHTPISLNPPSYPPIPPSPQTPHLTSKLTPPLPLGTSYPACSPSPTAPHQPSTAPRAHPPSRTAEAISRRSGRRIGGLIGSLMRKRGSRRGCGGRVRGWLGRRGCRWGEEGEGKGGRSVSWVRVGLDWVGKGWEGMYETGNGGSDTLLHFL